MVESPEKADPDENPNNQIKNPNLQYVFNPERDKFPAKHYLEDGNPEMYTTENMQKRDDLFNDPIVKSAINKFIDDQFTGNKSGLFTKDAYLMTFSKCASVLRSDLSHEEISNLLREEFEHDCIEKKKKNRKQ